MKSAVLFVVSGWVLLPQVFPSLGITRNVSALGSGCCLCTGQTVPVCLWCEPVSAVTYVAGHGQMSLTFIWCCSFDLIQQWCFLKTSPHALQAATKGGLRPPCLVSLPVFCSKCSSVALSRACLLSRVPVMNCASRFSAAEINASG